MTSKTRYFDTEVAQFFLKLSKKLKTSDFTLKVILQNTPKLTKHLGYFLKLICHQERQKIAQYCHTANDLAL